MNDNAYIFDNYICCEKCKAQIIQDHALETIPVVEADFNEIPVDEVTIFTGKDNAICGGCLHYFQEA